MRMRTGNNNNMNDGQQSSTSTRVTAAAQMRRLPHHRPTTITAGSTIGRNNSNSNHEIIAEVKSSTVSQEEVNQQQQHQHRRRRSSSSRSPTPNSSCGDYSLCRIIKSRIYPVVLFLLLVHYYWTTYRTSNMVVNNQSDLSSYSSRVYPKQQQHALPRFGRNQKPSSPSSRTNDNNKKNIDLNPFDNVPPTATKLLLNAEATAGNHDNSTNHASSSSSSMTRMNMNMRNMIQKRHRCVHEIRKRQFTMLEPHIRKYNQNESSSSSLFRHVLLVDPAYLRNVGDHMISLGEIEFLYRIGYGTGISYKSGSGGITGSSNGSGHLLQCNYCQAGPYVRQCEEVLSSSSSSYNSSQVALQPAMWHGGGNWGDLWRVAQHPRLNSFVDLLKKNYTVIGMPQSFHYSDTALERQDADKLKEKITYGLSGGNDVSYLDTGEGRKEALKRVILTWREVESHAKAKQWFPFVTNIIVPDIAFQLGPYERTPTEIVKKNPMHADILLFLREDKESVLTKPRNKATVRNMLSSIDGGEALHITIADWKDALLIFETSNYFFSENSVKLLSLGRVVICDRLHAAILCYLTGIPFVYIDQVSGKISKTLNVAFDSWDGCKDGDAGMWARATDMKMALELAVSFLDKYKL